MATAALSFDALAGAGNLFSAHTLHQASYDDFIAATAVFVGGLAYLTHGTLWAREDPYRYKLFEKPQKRAGTSLVTHRTDDLGELLESENCDVAILWASQSGTAERLAGRLAKELQRNFGAKVSSLDISDVSPASLMNVNSSKVVIFMASTFGEGDPSDNLHQMWSWLRADGANNLSNLKFLAFGLGNSKYKHYNHVIDVLVETMLLRGAQMLMSVGKADDAAGETEEHFLEWKQRVFEFFRDVLQYQQQEARYEPSLEILEDHASKFDDIWAATPYVSKALSSQSKVEALPIVRSYNLLQSPSDRKCLHMELDITNNPQLKYKTGDYLSVWATNPAQEVQILLSALGLEEKRHAPICIKSLDRSVIQIPTPSTLESVLQAYVEICAPVSRESIGLLLRYAPTTSAQEFLKIIGSDKTSHAEYARSKYLNLGRLLEAACPTPGAWNSVPLSLVLEILPAMQPRSYSISSSSVVSPRRIAITVAVSDTTTAESPDRVIGLATNYLLSTEDGNHPLGLTYSRALDNTHIYAAVRRSTFKMPITSSAPIIMVGAGTGVAPFRAFAQERARLKSMGRDVGMTRLFFGCRNNLQDFLYADEFSDWAEKLGDCFQMTTAFSRPQEEQNKRYVQDALLEDGEAVCKLLVDANAYFYICGSAAMARDVSTTIAKMIMARQSWSEQDMKDFADRQKRQKRWLQDVWG